MKQATDFFDIFDVDEEDVTPVREVCKRCFMEVSVVGACECTEDG